MTNSWTSLTAAWLLLTTTSLADERNAVDYTTQIAPMLRKYCAGCHNAEDREGSFSVESFADLQRGGETGPALLAGDSASSRLIRLLTGQAEPKMPPEDNKAPSAGDIELLRKWIDQGAAGPNGPNSDGANSDGANSDGPNPNDPNPNDPAERHRLVTPSIEPAAEGPPAITAMAVAPHRQLVALARFGRIELQSLDGRPVQQLDGLPGKVNAVHFSRDGSRLVAASGVTGLYGQALSFDVDSGRRLSAYTAHRDTLYDAELSPDGRLLATCSYDHAVTVWDAASGERLRVLAGHNDAVYDLAFSVDGTVLATASGDETVKLWRLDTGQRLDTLSQPQAEQYTVAFSPDGRYVLAGGADNRIRIWRFVSRQRQQINPLLFARFAHEGAVTQLAFSEDGGLLASVAEDNSIKLWETDGFTQLQRYETPGPAVSGVAFINGGRGLLLSHRSGTTSRLSIDIPTAVADGGSAGQTALASPAAEATNRLAEHEPNNTPEQAMDVFLPAQIEGLINSGGRRHSADQDLFRFQSQAGQQWVVEVKAARDKSPLDSRVEILDELGNPVPRVLLQAVRDSYFNFRGTDSDTSDGLRLHNWEEMELNELLYANGEVLKLWHYPRGPDSGFQVYPGSGKRWTYFDTTALAHALHEPCYIVEPREPGAPIVPNGLPVFPIYYENDDDGLRRWGADSRLTFVAPAAGRYLLKVTDARGFGGDEYKYQVTIRPRRPDFKLQIAGMNPTVHAGSGQEFSLKLERLDGFAGPVRVDISDLPPGFHTTAPIVIEAGQQSALGAIYAEPTCAPPTAENSQRSQVTATAVIGGQQTTREVGSLGQIKLADKPQLQVRLARTGSGEALTATASADQPLELVIAPGQTITARVQIERHGFEGRVGFGRADAGRNLPHGVYVDNIGLNGLLIVEGQNERTFFITAAKWVPESTRRFHLRAEVEGNPTSWPVVLHVRRSDTVAWGDRD